jgi:SAM-dependent methyltransferase
VSLWGQGAPYERFVGRWSRLVAPELLAWLNVDVDAGAAWLDVGSGTGALSSAVLETASPGSVTGVDFSEGFVEHARSAVPGATFVVGDAQSLPFEADSFDVVVSGLVLNFVPDQPRAVAEMTRVAKPGGTVAVYVWDYAGRMELIRYFWATASELDPAARELDEAQRFSAFERPEGLERLLGEAGQVGIESRAIEIATVFRDFDDYWEPFLGGQGPAPSYAASLGEAEQSRLREALRQRLPAADDGSISLVARAWAARGRKP